MKSAKHWDEETAYLCAVLRDAIVGSRHCGSDHGSPISARNIPAYLGCQAASARVNRFYGLALVLDAADDDAQRGLLESALRRIESWRAAVQRRIRTDPPSETGG